MFFLFFFPFQAARAKLELDLRHRLDLIHSGHCSTTDSSLSEQQQLSCECFSSDPRRVNWLRHELAGEETRVAELEHCVAVRPEKATYDTLLSSVQLFTISIASSARILELWASAKRWQTCSTAERSNLQQSLLTWQKSVRQFCLQLQSRHALYADIHQPFLAALSQVRHQNDHGRHGSLCIKLFDIYVYLHLYGSHF